MPTKSRITRALPRIEASDSESRIEALRRVPVRPFSDPETLETPLDEDVEIRELKPGLWQLVLRAGEQDVSWAQVWHFTQQIGAQAVQMGGIAGVGTHKDYRFKGLSRRVMQNTLRWMRQNGYGVAMLYGIPSFYPKFGFAPAFPDISWWLNLRDAERLPARVSGLKFVPFAPEYTAGVLSLYHKVNLGRTGVIYRDAKTWKPFRHGRVWQSKAAVFVGIDPLKKIAAYIAYDDVHPETTIIEAGWKSAEYYADLLQHAAERALKNRVEKIRFELPGDSQFMEFCKFVGIRQEQSYRSDAAAMVRMIDLPVAFVSIGQVLASRMAGVPAGSLAIKTNLDHIGVRWGEGRLEVTAPNPAAPEVRLPQWALAQLFYGYHKPETLYALGVLSGPGEGVNLLSSLFPHQPHYFYRTDEF